MIQGLLSNVAVKFLVGAFKEWLSSINLRRQGALEKAAETDAAEDAAEERADNAAAEIRDFDGAMSALRKRLRDKSNSR